MSGKPGQNLPHPIDVTLGARIKACRKDLGLSQEELAQECGLTFQQIQKYEHGTNRITFSRLIDICRTFGMSVAEMIAPFDIKTNRTETRVEYLTMLGAPHAMEALRYFTQIADRKRRKVMLDLLKTMAELSGAQSDCDADD
jgi:transcriptional regulator with XRE-family HTH domain